MITYKDILFSITKILSDNFDCDVIIDNSEGIFENECFYATLVPMNSTISTKSTNKKDLMVSVKYFCGDKLKNYDMADKLESLFARTLKVKDRFINISSIEPTFPSDEVGTMLDFLIYLSYFEKINNPIEKVENFENMEEINLNMKG